MKRRIFAFMALAVFLCFFGSTPAFSQEESPLRFGVKLGMNISDFRGDDDVEGWAELLDWKLGFCGGAFMSYAVNDWFALQPELLYSMKGMKLGVFSQSITFSLDYIEVPVLAMFKLPKESRFKPFAYAGPVFGFNVRSKMSVNFFGDQEADLSDFVETFEFSLALGAGMNIHIAGRELTLEGRYVPGLTSVWNEDMEEGADLSGKMYNDTISILLGYAF